ncbi:hypothetical protein [Xanthobacter autotrophicus]|uniref:hypothetical protein n=1 Tax=Xanthobacter autotrophicus TaxID=280 RepID=UPI0037270669
MPVIYDTALDCTPAIIADLAAELSRHSGAMAALAERLTTPSEPEPALVTPAAPTGGKVVAMDETVTVWGQKWVGHTSNNGGATPRGVVIDGSSVYFRATAREHAKWDPSNGRLVRAELCGTVRAGKGQTLTAEFDFTIPSGPTYPYLVWRSLYQIHQADTYYVDAAGNLVAHRGTPPLAIELAADASSPTGEVLLVRGETSTGDGKALTAPLRVLAKVPFARGAHHLKVDYIDDHGGPDGLIRVALDGVSVVDKRIATGYAYVDQAPPINGVAQRSGSYPKIGWYAGRDTTVPADLVLEMTVSNLSISIK